MNKINWAHSSGEEYLLDAQVVGGSKPPAPTKNRGINAVRKWCEFA